MDPTTSDSIRRYQEQRRTPITGLRPGAGDWQTLDHAFCLGAIQLVADREFATDRGLTDQTDLVDATGTRLLYEQPLREYLATFPEENGVPTIQEDDARYQYPDGDGRISIAE
ncbi:MAG: hypothetical protein HC893_13250 [Chloroflexaceae bacterium]|nr:hypothetical protein [Chloroflexaceae bacterium]